MFKLFPSKIVSGSFIMQHSSRQCTHDHFIQNDCLPLSITMILTACASTITNRRRRNEESTNFHSTWSSKQQIHPTENFSTTLIVMLVVVLYLSVSHIDTVVVGLNCFFKGEDAAMGKEFLCHL